MGSLCLFWYLGAAVVQVPQFIGGLALLVNMLTVVFVTLAGEPCLLVRRSVRCRKDELQTLEI